MADRLLQQYQQFKKFIGTFKIGDDGKYYVGTKAFNTPKEAIQYVHTSGIRSTAILQQGTPLNKMPRIGPQNYVNIEELVEDIGALPSMQGLTVERVTVSAGQARKYMAEELTRNQKIHGFSVPDDDATTFLRMYIPGAKGTLEELTSEQIESAMQSIGYSWNPDRMKVFKRMKQLVNIEQFSAKLDGPVRVQQLNSDMLKALNLGRLPVDHPGFDGLMVANPNFVLRQVEALKDRADILGSSDDILERNEAIKMMADARALEDLAYKGGRMQAGRYMNLVDENNKPIAGMAKGDVLVPSIEDYVPGMQRLGILEEEALKLDLVASPEAITTELSRVGADASYITSRPASMTNQVRVDIQSLMGYGDDLHDLSLYDRYTGDFIENAMDQFEKTGTIPPGYRDTLEQMARKTTPDAGESMLTVMGQKSRAQAILDAADSKLSPLPQIVSEFGRGLTEMLVNKKHGIEPGFLSPATIYAQVGNEEWAGFGFSKGKSALARDEVSFDRRFGWVMREDDIKRYKAVFGGFDLDDTLRMHLRYSDQDGAFRLIATRSPLSHGEAAAFRINLEENTDMIRYMFAGSQYQERLAPTLQAIRDVDKEIAQARRELRQVNAGTAEAIQLSDAISAAQANRKLYTTQMLNELQDIVPHVESFAPFTRHIEKDGVYLPKRADHYVKYRDWERGVDEAHLERLTRRQFGDIPSMVDELSRGGTALNRSQAERIVLNEVTEGLIGEHFNVQIIADSIRRQIEDNPALAGRVNIPYIDPEDVIDPLTQGTQHLDDFGNPIPLTDTLRNIERASNAMIEGIADAVITGEVKLPRELVAERLKEAQREGGGRRGYFEELLRAGGVDIDDESIYLDRADPDQARFDTYGRWTEAWKNWRKSTEESMSYRLMDREGYDFIQDAVFSDQNLEDARRMVDVFDTAQDFYGDTLHAPPLDDISRSVPYEELFGAGEGRGRKLATMEMQRAFGSLFEETGEMGQRAEGALGAFIQQYGKRYGSALLNSDLAAPYISVLAKHRLGAGIEGLDEDSANKLQELANREITAEQVLRRPEEMLPDMPEPIRKIMDSGDYVPGSRRAAAMGAAADASEGIWRRITKGGLKEFFDIPFNRNAGILALGAVGFSAVYSRMSDRSPEDLEGPPLLPGGGAYEGMSAVPNLPPPSGGYAPQGSSGVTYRVVANGKFDHSTFRSEAESLTGASASGSTYSASRGFTDVMREVGESF